jgi:hypothetical protein
MHGWTVRLAGALFGLAAICGLTGTLGCGGKTNPKEIKYSEVTGSVFMKDKKPLPGGRITFVTSEWGFAATGTIGEDGHYSVKAPVGAVKIAVDNSMLNARNKHDAPVSAGMKAHSGGEAVAFKGKFVAIPPKYYNADESGLTYMVTEGPQTHDIQLE